MSSWADPAGGTAGELRVIQRPAFGKLGNRGGARIALGVAGHLALPQRTVACTIEDASRSGARLRISRQPMAALPRVGTPAMLRFFEGEMLGAIAWASGERCAVRFDRPMTPPDLERLRWIADNPERHAQARMSENAALWR